MASNTFIAEKDIFCGVTVTSCDMDISEFEGKLIESLSLWKDRSIRAVWFKVLLKHPEWIPYLVKYVSLVLWLPSDEQYNIPVYAHHMIGVGSVVLNKNDEILAVKERFRSRAHWKFPGGYVEPGENLEDAAIREVLEETGIHSKFQGIITFRHTKKANFGCSDIYFVCSLIAKSGKIKICPRELQDCRWMKVTEFINHPEVMEANKILLKRYISERVCSRSEIRKPETMYSTVKERIYYI